MSMTLDELKAKVPTAHHLPKEDCKYCHGTGFRHKKLPKTEFWEAREFDTPCICVFVDHDMSDMAQEMMNETIDKNRNERENI